MVANCDSDSEIARMNRGVNSLPYTCTYNSRPNCHTGGYCTRVLGALLKIVTPGMRAYARCQLALRLSDISWAWKPRPP
jgi:hypothetical protein|eukprot:COSAG03_NODE_21_length_21000_cov_26.440649_5_plen_79_part_00